jgi:hypothetical protein
MIRGSTVLVQSEYRDKDIIFCLNLEYALYKSRRNYEMKNEYLQ